MLPLQREIDRVFHRSCLPKDHLIAIPIRSGKRIPVSASSVTKTNVNSIRHLNLRSRLLIEISVIGALLIFQLSCITSLLHLRSVIEKKFTPMCTTKTRECVFTTGLKNRKQGRNVSCRACFYFHLIVERGLDEMS